MQRRFSFPLCCLLLAAGTLSTAAAEPAEKPETYLLRYCFEPGQTLCFDVVHRNLVKTSVSGTTETVETRSQSLKIWRVRQVRPDGAATIEYSVGAVDMWHKRSGSAEVRYNSRTDQAPPRGFEHLAQSIGVPLAIITLDSRGQVLHREDMPAKAAAQPADQITLCLPEEPVPEGYRWSSPYEIQVPRSTGGMTTVKLVQRFVLEQVCSGVATIRVSTEILTPLGDPAVESQVVQYAKAGQIRFDVQAGRILSQQWDVDRHVVGFRGPASSLHYVARFTEQLQSAETHTAARQSARR